jgi:phosphoribosyl 1,2-cyclic phosphodiesterase
MELKVLGSSSSGNCYLLQNDKETLIIECGLPYKSILKGLNFNLSNVVGCLVSHEHNDHSKAMRDLLLNGIDVYTSMGTARAIARKFEVIETYHRLNYIKSEKQFKAGGFTILPFAIDHDTEEPLGFLISHSDIGKLLFVTDTYYIRYKFNGLKHLLIECNYSKKILQNNIGNGSNEVSPQRLLRSHFSFENLKEFLKVTDLRKCEDITLIHLSDSNSNAKQFKAEIEELTGIPVNIADKGLVIEL